MSKLPCERKMDKCRNEAKQVDTSGLFSLGSKGEVGLSPSS